MKYGDNWERAEIGTELKEKLGGVLKEYYKWKLKTYEAGYAHVFFCNIGSCEELDKSWKRIVDHIAVLIQGEVPDLLERSNFYIWFFVKGKVEKKLVKEIEDDTYSSRKFVVQRKSETEIDIDEMLQIAQNKLFSFNFAVPESDTPMVTRVEFSNFRVYKGERIFDFYKNGIPARLIVLFAPNGMGKTSFFDGIEWGLSGSVSRFLNIADKNISKIPVLKHTEAQNETAYVKIYIQGGHWIKRKVSNLNGRTNKDYGAGTVEWSQNNPLGEYLLSGSSSVLGNLILPHHKIDGFIAGMKPTVLYKEWGGLWDFDGKKRKQFEKAYEKRREAVQRCDSVKAMYTKLQNEYKKLEKSRDFVERLEQNIDAYNEILGNAIIEKLNFAMITASEYVQWSNQVDIQYESLEKEIDIVTKKWEYLERESGNDFKKYVSLELKIKEYEQEQLKVRDFLEKCNNKSMLHKQKETFMKELEKTKKVINQVRFLQEKGEEWYQDAIQYFDADRSIDDLGDQLSELEKHLETFYRERNQLMVELKEKIEERKEEKEYKMICEHADQINELSACNEKLIAKKENGNKKLEELKLKKSVLDLKEIKLEKKIIRNFETLKSEYSDDLVLQINDGAEYELEEIFHMVRKYKELEEKKLSVTQQVLAEEQVEERMKRLLTEVREIIEEQEITHCPVCNTNFCDTRELLQSTYKVVTKEGQERKGEMLDLEKEMFSIKFCAEEEINKYNKDLTNAINSIVSCRETLKQDIKEKTAELQEIDKKSNDLINLIEEIKKGDRKKGLYVIYIDEGIKNWRMYRKSKLDSEIKEIKTNLETNREQISSYLEKVEELKEKRDNQERIFVRMLSQQSECYNMMWETEGLIKTKTYSELCEWEQEQISIYEDIEKKTAECTEKLEELQDIEFYQKDYYEERDKMIQQYLENVKEEILAIRKRIEEVFSIEITPEIDEMYFCSIEKKSRKNLLAQKEHIQLCMESLKNLKYNREAENYFLRWKELSEEIKGAEEKTNKEEENLRHAEENYDLQKQKVEAEMEEFLKRYRMGELYEKLEPHEELKRLTAKFSFNEKDQPELSFSVVGEEGKSYPPAWYLSTAQLNIVAFAIFLGRALQKEEVPLKSIFIDDPIGHFDEMNIVGFVDLLRNILENTDRQIIISTHEERIFGLMKRKMPEENYPTCYIDFREWMA